MSEAPNERPSPFLFASARIFYLAAVGRTFYGDGAVLMGGVAFGIFCSSKLKAMASELALFEAESEV